MQKRVMVDISTEFAIWADLCTEAEFYFRLGQATHPFGPANIYVHYIPGALKDPVVVLVEFDDSLVAERFVLNTNHFPYLTPFEREVK